MFNLLNTEEIRERLFKYRDLLADKNAMFLFIALPELLITNASCYSQKGVFTAVSNILKGLSVSTLALLYFCILNTHNDRQIEANRANQVRRPRADAIDIAFIGALYFIFATDFFQENLIGSAFLTASVYLYFYGFSKNLVCKNLFAAFIAMYVHIYNIGFNSREIYRLEFDKSHTLFTSCLIYTLHISVQDLADVPGDRIEERKTAIILCEDYFGRLQGNIFFRTFLASTFVFHASFLAQQSSMEVNSINFLLIFEATVNVICGAYLYLSAYYLLDRNDDKYIETLHVSDEHAYILFQTSTLFWTTRSALTDTQPSIKNTL